jgi:uncharacterized protein with HEPN domain
MRDERLYLTDIVEAADAVARFLGSMSVLEFEQNDLVATR